MGTHKIGHLGVSCADMTQERTPTQWERDNPWEALLARNIGRAITEARRGKMSQEELANALGVSRNSIANYEVGRGIPRLGLLIQIAAALDTSPVALMYPDPSDDPGNLVEILPGVETTGFKAAQWFSGIDHFPIRIVDEEGVGYEVDLGVIDNWSDNTSRLRQWRQLVGARDARTKELMSRDGNERAIALYDNLIRDLERQLGIDDDA